MKPIMMLALATFAVASCSKSKPVPPAAAPVAKEITFSVFAEKDYSGGATSPYGYKSATVKLSLEKMVKDAPNVHIIWDTTFLHRSLSDFPMQPQQHRVQKVVPLREGTEQLFANYEVIYGGLYDVPQRFGFSKLLENGQNNLQVNVAL